MAQHEVILYTRPGRGACHQEVGFLSRNNAEFTEKNVRADPDAIGELVEIKSQSTPTTIVDGEAIIGFDRQISEKLGL